LRIAGGYTGGLNRSEDCAIHFRGLVPLSPPKEMRNERIRKAVFRNRLFLLSTLIIMDRNASCPKRFGLCLTCRSGKSV
jgi:hypothetical protein